MNNLKKIIYSFIVLLFILSLTNCANARWSTNAGVDVIWGSHGPKIRPNLSVDLYNGGRLHH